MLLVAALPLAITLPVAQASRQMGPLPMIAALVGSLALVFVLITWLLRTRGQERR